jgi:hypothetical protein
MPEPCFYARRLKKGEVVPRQIFPEKNLAEGGFPVGPQKNKPKEVRK